MSTPNPPSMRTAISTRVASDRAERTLSSQRLRAPATIANSTRNARAEIGRHARWAPARDAFWLRLERYLSDGARVAILGAGNGDTLPLDRIAERAAEVALIDLDSSAIRAARRRQRRHRRRITTVECDVTDGAANAIAAAAARGEVPQMPAVPEAPLPGAPYDLVIGDLLYSQLLYPALIDLRVTAARTNAFVSRYAPILTQAVVARLAISAPTGTAIHVHDPIAWWPGHPQPVALELILEIARNDPAAALTLASQGTGPRQSDPRSALRALSIPIHATELWHWPFAAGVDYLACATVTRSAPSRQEVARLC
jgi:hypothetical protein